MRNSSGNSNAVISAALAAAGEYALIVLPVCLYVAFEAYAKADAHWLGRSPEWGIATVFLALQAQTLFRAMVTRHARYRGQAAAFDRSLSLTSLLISIFAILVLFKDLTLPGEESPSTVLIASKWVLLLSATGLFFVLVGAAELRRLREENG